MGITEDMVDSMAEVDPEVVEVDIMAADSTVVVDVTNRLKPTLID